MRSPGRYIHAEHDDIEDLIVRADEIVRERPERDSATALGRCDPGGAPRGQHSAVFTEQRGRGVELSSVLAERPGEDDAWLAGLRQLVDPDREQTQQRLA